MQWRHDRPVLKRLYLGGEEMGESSDANGQSDETLEPVIPQKTPKWGTATRVLLEDWHFRVTRAQFGHQLSADQTRSRHLLLGVPVVIFTTVVGTAAFAAINQDTNDFWKVAAGTISIVAAVLASMQTFFGFGELSDRHRAAATRYANTRRSIELALTSEDAVAVPFIKGEMDRIGAASPQIAAAKWDEARPLAKEAIEAWHREERRAARNARDSHEDAAPTAEVSDSHARPEPIARDRSKRAT
jgi:hypothetical protein